MRPFKAFEIETGVSTHFTKHSRWATCLVAILILFVPHPSQAEGQVAAPVVGDVDPVISFLESPELWKELQDTSKSLNDILSQVHSFSYRIPFAPGQHLYVTESFSLRSVLRQPARAAIFFTGPSFRGSFWSIPVEGYNITEMAAQRGFHAFTLDYVGVGGSYRPPDGSKATSKANVDPAQRLIDFVRKRRRVDRVDVIGEGFGAAIAATLGADSRRVRSVVLSTVTYRDMNPELLVFFSPQFEAFLRNQPQGYWEPNNYGQTLVASPSEQLRSWVLETQPGAYPTGQALQFWDLGMPYFDPALAEVPALIIQGELDAFPAPGDTENLVNDWRAGAELVIIPEAGHVPRIESQRSVGHYVDSLFGFLDR